MKTTYLCARCALGQIERALEYAFPEWGKREEVMEEVVNMLAHDFGESIPAHFGTKVHRIIFEKAGRDMFEEWKQTSREVSKNVLSENSSKLVSLKDRVIASIVANYIDFTNVDGEEEIAKLGELMQEGLAVDEFDKFEKAVSESVKILYLPDNVGEHLFDLLVIERLKELGKDVIVAGKSEPIMNDCTIKDLKADHFGDFAKIISLGSNCIGVNFEEVSEEFKQVWDSCDLVIAKGMGHYETLDDNPKKIAFLLRAKCSPVARALGVKKGENVLKVKNENETAK